MSRDREQGRVDDRLAELRDSLARERRVEARAARRVARGPRRNRLAKWLLRVGVAVVAIGLPFVILVRGAVEIELAGAPTWVAVVGGAGLAGTVIAVVAALLTRRLTGRARLSFAVRWIAAPLVIGWTVYALLFLAAVNAKSPEVRSEFRTLHPTLRLAVSTVALADADVVVTDLARQASDYERMGLTPRERSLHYRQADGWVHAADIRTLGRPWWRIGLTTAGFRLLGFRVLRHGGTGDHLHVSTRFEFTTSSDR